MRREVTRLKVRGFVEFPNRIADIREVSPSKSVDSINAERFSAVNLASQAREGDVFLDWYLCRNSLGARPR